MAGYAFNLRLNVLIDDGEALANVEAALGSLVKQGDVLEPLVDALSSVCAAEITTTELVSHIDTVCQIPITPDEVREHFLGGVAVIPRSGRSYQEVANNSDDVDIAHHVLLIAQDDTAPIGGMLAQAKHEVFAAALRSVDGLDGA